MNTINDKLNWLNETKVQIRNAIIEKGIEVIDSDTFRSYADKIREISGAFYVPDGMRFNGSTSTEFPELNLINVKTMNVMFYGCQNITDLSIINTDNVTSMTQAFTNCKKLHIIPYMKMQNVKDMRNAYEGCESAVTAIELNTVNATDMSSCFKGCSKLNAIYSIDFSSLTSMSNMFDGCVQLRNMTIHNLGKSSLETYDFSALEKWGLEDGVVASSKQSLLDSIYTNAYDRKSKSMPVATIKLHQNVRNYFNQEQIQTIESKGYKIMPVSSTI